MKNTDLKNKEILIILLIICISVLLFIGTCFCVYRYMNSVDESTREYGKIKFLDFTSFDEERVDKNIRIKNAQLITKSGICIKDYLVDELMSMNQLSGFASDVIDVVRTVNEYSEKQDFTIFIPKEATYVGIADISESMYNLMDETESYIPKVDIYAWSERYKLRSGTQKNEAYIYMDLDGEIILSEFDYKDSVVGYLLDDTEISIYYGKANIEIDLRSH